MNDFKFDVEMLKRSFEVMELKTSIDPSKFITIYDIDWNYWFDFWKEFFKLKENV